MTLKRLLILAPLVVLTAMLQSYLWVPTYDKQTLGNPGRLRTFISASSADAKILNPVQSADATSGAINNLIFESLLDIDEELNWQGQLATDWTITEQAYLLVNPDKSFPDGTPVSGPALAGRIRRALDSGQLPELVGVLQTIRLLEPEQRTETISLGPKEQAAQDTDSPQEVTLTITMPERVAFSLSKVDQDFFDRLQPILGETYTQDFPYERYVTPATPSSPEQIQQLRSHFPRLLPVAEHNPIIVFTLRRDVRFQDGQPFDADDVRFTYESVMNPRNLSPRVSDFEPIKRLDVLDPYTVRVTYKRLFSPATTPWTYMGMLPEHLLNDAALEKEMDERNLSVEARKTFSLRESRFNRAPIGTGPFRLVEWRGGEYIHLQRNDDYWQGPAEYEHVYVRVIPDKLTQEMEFRAGAIDVYGEGSQGIPPHQIVRYKQDETYQALSNLALAYTYIGYNTRHPLFADKRVRRALGMAINIDEIVTYLMYGEGERVTGPYPKETEWYDHSVPPLPYDPDGAKQILAELGWQPNAEGWLEKDGQRFAFNLITNSGNPIRKNILTIVQDAWQKIGVQCHTQYFEWAVFLEDFVNTSEFDALILGWTTPPIDADLYQIFHSSQIGQRRLNFVGYDNPQADRLIERIRREYDRAQQRQLAHQLHRLIAEDQPYTFLFSPRATWVFDKKIVLVEQAADGSEQYRQLYPTLGGDTSYYFNKMRKLAQTPEFAS